MVVARWRLNNRNLPVDLMAAKRCITNLVARVVMGVGLSRGRRLSKQISSRVTLVAQALIFRLICQKVPI